MGVNKTGNEIKNNITTQFSYVKFADVNMATSKSVFGTIFTRRNKCLIVILFVTVLFFIFLLNIGVFSSVPSYTGDLCKLDEIPVQDGFDKKKFSGNWYVTYTKALESSLLATLMDFYDVKINFVHNDGGAFDIKSGK